MKTWLPLENNPQVLNPLAHELGLSPTISFHDIYSFTDPDLLALIPRPVYALVVTIPMTPAWAALRQKEDAAFPDKSPYRQGTTGTGDPVIWFTQNIGHACGSIAVTHGILNGVPKELIKSDSFFAHLLSAAPKVTDITERANLLHDSTEFETAHRSNENHGDTLPPDLAEAEHLGNHFIAFVKGEDGHLWELEGSRKGPIDRGLLGEDEDVLSQHAYELGIGQYVEIGKGVTRFSATALAVSSNDE